MDLPNRPIDLPAGTKVRIIGKHPHAGKHGEFVEFRRTIFGMRPVVRLEDGSECFVMDPSDWEREPPMPTRSRPRRRRR